MKKVLATVAVMGLSSAHEHRDGRHVLSVSADFQVPGSPNPHWQIVDSKGGVYLLDRLKLRDDKINRSITLPAPTSPRSRCGAPGPRSCSARPSSAVPSWPSDVRGHQG